MNLEEVNEEENHNIKGLFLKSLQDYGEKVAALNDPNSIKAMKAITRTLRKRMNCNPHTIQNQLYTFCKGGAAARKSKWGRVIKPNPPAVAARLVLGSGPAPLGRRFKDRRGQEHFGRWAGGPSRKSSCVPKQKTAQSNTCNF